MKTVPIVGGRGNAFKKSPFCHKLVQTCITKSNNPFRISDSCCEDPSFPIWGTRQSRRDVNLNQHTGRSQKGLHKSYWRVQKFCFQEQRCVHYCGIHSTPPPPTPTREGRAEGVTVGGEFPKANEESNWFARGGLTRARASIYWAEPPIVGGDACTEPENMVPTWDCLKSRSILQDM